MAPCVRGEGLSGGGEGEEAYAVAEVVDSLDVRSHALETAVEAATVLIRVVGVIKSRMG
jgi:hypothetical protein